MKSPQSGTVTFLFTDIEGSTELAQGYPHSIAVLVERHDTILKTAIESHNGYFFQIIGDAFCAAFRLFVKRWMQARKHSTVYRPRTGRPPRSGSGWESQPGASRQGCEKVTRPNS